MKKLNLALSLIALVGLAACGSTEEPSDSDSDALACGMRTCAVEEGDELLGSSDLFGGDAKADAQDIQSAVAGLTADGVLDADDVLALFEETGNRVSKSEVLAIRDAIQATDYEVTDEAKEAAGQLALIANLPLEEARQVLSGRSFGGTEVPAAVRELLIQARLNGAVMYDVNEIDEDGERVWNPYPATTPPLENMAFDYTEITPQALADDMAATDLEYNVIVGVETLTHPQGFEYKAAKYEKGVGGTGSVLAHYDEVYHPDIYARGRSGQKWANNVAIMSDGTFHCLPASRRSFKQDLILTNPHLSRGKHLMYNGHLDIRNGVVVGIEMSGRVSKLAAKGKVNFIDPVALLEAWGFEISPNLRLRYGNTSDGTPVQWEGVVTAAE